MKEPQQEPKILMVDDRPENLFALEKILRRLDVCLVKATTGNEALMQTLHDDFALILLDVQMPGMNGYEVAEHLRGEEKTREIPIIFLTAIDRDENLEIQGYESGAVDYIFKPINPKILLGKVKVFVELYRNRLDLEATTRQLKENQTHLMQAEKMAALGQLAAGVAHEINNPMGYIISNLGTLKRYTQTFKRLIKHYESLCNQCHRTETAKSEEDKGLITAIEEIRNEEDLQYIMEDVDELLSESRMGTERVKEIVEGLKSFARLDDGQEKSFNINEGIETTLKIVWNELKYKCEIEKKLGDIPMIPCYPGQLNQVIMNLLVNAAQAIPEKGKITIETFTENEQLKIRVSDTGKGIPTENLSKLFDPFFTTKPQGEGTGLGLSSHGIIKKHKGEIDVQSEVGKGTIFTIALPLPENALWFLKGNVDARVNRRGVLQYASTKQEKKHENKLTHCSHLSRHPQYFPRKSDRIPSSIL